MKKVNIEDVVNEKKETTLSIPVSVLKVVSKLFPKKYLSHSSMNLEGIISAAESNVSGVLFEIFDHEDNEQITVSIS